MIECPRCHGLGTVIENRWDDKALRELLGERKAGMTWDSLGDKYGVTATRMQQVVQSAWKKGLTA